MNISAPCNTGERILPEKETPLMIARHLSAYAFAGSYFVDRHVLDVGCGEGYGSFYLAALAREVTAIDYDSVIIEHARRRHAKDNLRFIVLDVKDLDTITEHFWGICSFQFIEHIREAGGFLENIRRLLMDDGIFICSTPNKNDASPGSDVPLNRFHVREYLFEEFQSLLGEYFNQVKIFGLKRSRRLNFYMRLKKSGICNVLPDGLNPVKRFYSQVTCKDFVIDSDVPWEALDFISVCRK